MCYYRVGTFHPKYFTEREFEMVQKPFHELTTEEATDLARNCKLGAKSNDEIKRRLTEAGFHGEAAAVTSISHGPMFMAMLMVWGPNGEIISA